MTLVTITVVRDTPPDRHFSAWSRPKPAPDPLPGPSVASGVIPTKGGRNGVLQPPAGRAPQGRWRSSPWKRCNYAAPRGRGQGAPRTARCIKTMMMSGDAGDPSQGAPRTARCIKTPPATRERRHPRVREHPAPLGALRPAGQLPGVLGAGSRTTPHAPPPLARAPSACAPDLTRHRSVPTPTGRGRLPAHHPARPATGRYPQPSTRPRLIPHRLVRLRAGAGYQGEPPTTRRRNHG